MLEPLPAWRCVCVGEGASDYSAGSTERESVHGPEDPFLAPHTFLFEVPMRKVVRPVYPGELSASVASD